MKKYLMLFFCLFIIACNKHNIPSDNDPYRILAAYVTAIDYKLYIGVDEMHIHLLPEGLGYKKQLYQAIDTIIYSIRTMIPENRDALPKFRPDSRIWLSIELVSEKKRYYLGFYRNGVMIYEGKLYKYNETLAYIALECLQKELLDTVEPESIYYPTVQKILQDRLAKNH